MYKIRNMPGSNVLVKKFCTVLEMGSYGVRGKVKSLFISITFSFF